MPSPRGGRRGIASGLVPLLALSAILVVFSEAFYWYSGLSDYPARVLFYLIPTGALVWTLDTFRVEGWAGIVLAGAVYGFVVEGVLTPVVYGGFPFDPFAISYPSLGWHALLSVGFGLVLLHRLLGGLRAMPLVLSLAGFGVLWALWAVTFWLPENAGDPEASGGRLLHGQVSPWIFLGYTVAVTAILAFWHVVLGRTAEVAVPLHPAVLATLAALGALWFIVLVIPAAPWAVVELPVLVGLSLLGLRRLRASTPEPPGGSRRSGVLADLGRPVPLQRLGLLVVLPVSAGAVYALAGAVPIGEDVVRAVYQVTVGIEAALGWIAWLAALLCAWRAGSHDKGLTLSGAR